MIESFRDMKLHVFFLSLGAIAAGMVFDSYAAAPVIKGLTFTGPTPTLTIQGDIGTTNQLQLKTNLTQPAWLVVTNVLVSQSPYTVLDSTVTGSTRRFYRVAGIGPVTPPPPGMALVPAGTFTMGDANDGNTLGDAPTHVVFVSQFFMDTNLVTFDQWVQVVTWATNHGYSFNNPGAGKAGNQPVETVDWYDAVKWCNARSEMQGLTGCYYTNAAQTGLFRQGGLDLATNYVKWNANGFRLPTEAEWEKAARGGASGFRFPWGNTISQSQANYFGQPQSIPYDQGPEGYNPVWHVGDPPFSNPGGAFASNGLGLNDMAGNATEWCWDWYYSIYYYTSPGSDPHGPAGGTYRIVRGGAYNYAADLARCANRTFIPPTQVGPSSGFRCVRAF
jgi:formylglycine-generating enzyme required for sulfatase activity